MLQKPTIVMGLDEMSNADLLVFGNRVAKMLTNNPNYPTVNPPLATFKNIVKTYSKELEKWGIFQNKGSSVDKANCDKAREMLEIALGTIAYFCMNATRWDAQAFLSAGFEVKKEKQPILFMGPACNLRQDLKVPIGLGEIFLRWKRPLGVHRHLVKCYLIYRSTESDFSSAKQVKIVTKTKFTDTNLTAAQYYYWVVPMGASSGKGAISDVCVAYPKLAINLFATV